MQQGLYREELEKDACGIGMICNVDGKETPTIIVYALTMLENMEHRGACGCEENTGDGAGIMIKIPHTFFVSEARATGVILPDVQKYAVGFVFLPKDKLLKEHCISMITQISIKDGFELLWTRKVPTTNTMLGVSAKESEPDMIQVFITYKDKNILVRDLEKKLYILRNRITREVVKNYESLKEIFYFCSLSTRTIVYKGQLKASQLRYYYKDLTHPLFASSLAMVHSRFSTNTVPKWKLAQPFRMIAHNGEINTIDGNVNWWNAKEKSMLRNEEEFLYDVKDTLPVCSTTLSDSGNFDGVLEFLSRTKYSLPHALMMMIPKAWHNDNNIPQYKKDFYEYQEYLMEPWDGPASLIFTDGSVIGATLDRNGLRPSRYMLTKDNTIILASESGILPIPQEKIVYKANLSPGNILIIDVDNKKIVGNSELEDIVCKNRPYGNWLEEIKINLDNLSPIECNEEYEISLHQRLIASGFTKEDDALILQVMTKDGKEAIGSMGSDIPLAVLSTQAQHLSNYFKQNFAQVTNPPIDPLRENSYMSLITYLGGSVSFFNEKAKVKIIRLESPFVNKEDYYKILHTESHTIPVDKIACIFDVHNVNNLESAIDTICLKAAQLIENGARILVLDNCLISKHTTAIPSMMIIGAVHHFLIERGLRRSVSLLAKTSDVVEVHHFATLIGYGADAIYPASTLEYISGENLKNNLVENYAHAINAGLYKVMSKLGISTILSYKGAQAFEALGISSSVIKKCFKGTISRIEGMTFEQLAKEQIHKHQLAFSYQNQFPDEGKYQWKRRGEFHLFNPQSIHLLQYSTSSNDYSIFKKYTQTINEQEERACTLRSLFKFRKQKSIPLEEVETIENILKRFATGAMSFGSISEEAHTTLAIAMNRIGGKSNSGEGGEDSRRYRTLKNGDNTRSAIKQVASGRFGVTIEYLVNADELQIKMAQGAKPGEGGQLPGHKVDENIARIRHSTPGVGLISPPPHHDIYSIEDLAQLIFDLKNANEKARISVKLVSKAGVGIIASGVAKGHADHILISGFDGGTGASPLSSIIHAGLPWELGLAETHQTLMKNGLRDRVTLQTDGQLRTGKDLAIATLLGAEEWGIATAALVVSGCILMRKCHLNTCPVGIATQDDHLRQKFNGKVEHLVNYFHFLAQDLREIMAELGFRTVNEMVGKSEVLDYDTNNKHWKYANLDLSPIFFKQEGKYDCKPYKSIPQDHGIENVLDRKLIRFSELAISDRIQITSIFPVKSTDRAVGTMLSGHIAMKYGSQGLYPGSIDFKFNGSAGQSFGAFLINGVNFFLEGEANDYFGKGLSGGTLTVVPDANAKFEADKNIIIGNVALFGATSGKAFIMGKAGERFCVRNSGATVVVEGIGDNGCEYMTGGAALVLGDVGRNFAAGMSGGVAYLFSKNRNLESKINKEMVFIEKCYSEDLEIIRQLIREHFQLTSSKKALKILLNWENQKQWFTKIMPKEYKAVMLKRKTLQMDLKEKILK